MPPYERLPRSRPIRLPDRVAPRQTTEEMSEKEQKQVLVEQKREELQRLQTEFVQDPRISEFAGDELEACRRFNELDGEINANRETIDRYKNHRDRLSIDIEDEREDWIREARLRFMADLHRVAEMQGKPHQTTMDQRAIITEWIETTDDYVMRDLDAIADLTQSPQVRSYIEYRQRLRQQMRSLGEEISVLEKELA